MNYEIVNLKEKQVVGLAKETTNNNNKSVGDIKRLWEEFFIKGHYENIKNRKDNKSIGLYTDYQGDFTKPYNFFCCCEVNKIDSIENPLVNKTIPRGKYAKFIINGDVQNSVGKFWIELWQMNLDRKYSCDFEEYQNNTEDMQNQEIHIYISIN
ncbi:MAG: GyrI-like domain-containing protein [Terrisporobacter othiniensis]|uniref:GyrI-like domain-containing protein n=1 Tax=Terrisporobacter petrolearius TaxID=1460447 RepID=UPI0022E05B7C|nr:GyrI-like domain-containing protein [Terrisporobacter petrolearius]MDU4859763.1 GyrI-like domain-containing protein [Terrisporobacter othiniensis]MDU6994068.1 GyrI-like domain-containing protein [Terrisporobacter othiniensis]